MERSIAKARVTFDYFTGDQTRLMPAAAFEECAADVLRMLKSAPAGGTGPGPLARLLAEDVEAVVHVRFPQFPSSRAFGDAAVVTPWGFKSRLPSDPKLLQIVPVPARPFPDALRDPDLLPAERPASDYAAAAWGGVLVAGLVACLFLFWKQFLS